MGTARDLHSNVTIRNNLVRNTGGDGINIRRQALNSSMDVVVEDNTVVNTTFDGLAFLNGRPNASLNFDVTGNTVTHCGGAGYWMVNFANGSMDNLNLLVESNDFKENGEGIFLWDVADATHGSLDFDFGGGGTRSQGQNRLVDNTIDAFVADFAAIAENNWWGSDTGPVSVVEVEGGTLDFTPFLTTDPIDESGFNNRVRVSDDHQHPEPMITAQKMLEQSLQRLDEKLSFDDLGSGLEQEIPNN